MRKGHLTQTQDREDVPRKGSLSWSLQRDGFQAQDGPGKGREAACRAQRVPFPVRERQSRDQGSRPAPGLAGTWVSPSRSEEPRSAEPGAVTRDRPGAASLPLSPPGGLRQPPHSITSRALGGPQPSLGLPRPHPSPDPCESFSLSESQFSHL